MPSLQRSRKAPVMQRQTLTRALSTDISIRSNDGRTVFGIVVPYDDPQPIFDFDGEYDEVHTFGEFKRSIAERGDRIKLLSQHDRRTNPLGRAVLLEERRSGLYAEFKVSATQAGDEALELIRDGVLDSFSIGFQPIREQWNVGRTKRTLTESKLTEISLVTFPAFESAKVAGVRQQHTNISAEQAEARLRLLRAQYSI